MIRSKRFFTKRLKRALLSANRTLHNYHQSPDLVECPDCLGTGTTQHDQMQTCSNCNGSGIDSFAEAPHEDTTIVIYRDRAFGEQIQIDETNDFEEIALLINRRYSNLISLYRNW